MALSLNLRSVEKVNKVIHQVGQVILGKDEEVREVMTAFLADGHILLEDIPGVGKTTLALAFSKSLQLDYKRVQFTPDVLPSDLTGFSIYRRDEERFVYRKGSFAPFYGSFAADIILSKKTDDFFRYGEDVCGNRTLIFAAAFRGYPRYHFFIPDGLRRCRRSQRSFVEFS